MSDVEVRGVTRNGTPIDGSLPLHRLRGATINAMQNFCVAYNSYGANSRQARRDYYDVSRHLDAEVERDIRQNVRPNSMSYTFNCQDLGVRQNDRNDYDRHQYNDHRYNAPYYNNHRSPRGDCRIDDWEFTFDVDKGFQGGYLNFDCDRSDVSPMDLEAPSTPNAREKAPKSIS